MQLRQILRLDFIPSSPDLAIFVLRVWLGLSLLLLHGWNKASGYGEMAEKFSDPLGVGSQVSLSLAILGEVVGSALVVLGLFTRIGALLCLATMAVAFFMAHDMALKGPRSGEMAFIYLAGFVTIFIAGSRRFGLDAAFGKSKTKGWGERKSAP